MLYDELVSEVPPVEEQSPREPQGLFHVALDLPGCGQSEGRLKAFNDDPAQVLADVAKCLGKTHVFALVGAGNGANAILRALAKQPMLANFVTLCNPTADKAATGGQGAIVLQPTLIVQTEKGTKAPIEGSGRSLISALPRGLLVEPVEADFVKITAGRSLRLFEQYSWRAHLPDAGTTKGLPRLSRLAGGLQAWQAAPRGADMIQVRKPRPAPKA
jgi:pimeloyl-ACP methyl ester carboxylesterase